MRLNKKQLTCFFLIMFFTLISCCAISAADNADTNTVTTTNNEVTNIQTVEQTKTIHNLETKGSTGNIIQSENDNIEETADQNDVEDENNNTKAINKTKIQSSVKGLQTSLDSRGTVTLTDDVRLSSGITLTGNLIINGNGHTITYTGSGNLFTAGSYSITMDDVTVTGVSRGYVISGGSGHSLTSSVFVNNRGLWETTSGEQTVSIVNCNVNCTGTAIYTKEGNNHCTYTLYNSIFQGPYPIIRQHNWATFNGYNFIIIKNDGKAVLITKQNYESYRDQNKVEGTQPIHEQQHAVVDTTTYTSDVNIEITASDVHINETNDIKIRLTAYVKDCTVGVPYEYVYLTITYADGTTENLQGITNANGEVTQLTDHDGKVTIPITASESGIVNVNVDFRGSRFADDNGGNEIYYPTSKSQTYNVLKLPTNTTVSFDETTATLGDTVQLKAQVTSTYKNSTNSTVTTTVNEGTVKFYSGSTLIGEGNIVNGQATFDYTTNIAGQNNIKAVFKETDHFTSSESTTKILEIQKANSYITVTTPYVDTIGKNVSLTASVKDEQQNPINTGKIRFTLENGQYFDIPVSQGQATFTNYIIETIDDYTVKAQFIEDDNYHSSEQKDIIVQGLKIPTVTTIDEVTGIVGKEVTITAKVKNESDSSNVPQEKTLLIKTINYKIDNSHYFICQPLINIRKNLFTTIIIKKNENIQKINKK